MSSIRSAITATSLSLTKAVLGQQAPTGDEEKATTATTTRPAGNNSNNGATVTNTSSANQSQANRALGFSVPGAIQGAVTGAMPGMMGMNPMAAMMGAGMGAMGGALGGGGSPGGGSSGGGSSSRRKKETEGRSETRDRSGSDSGPEDSSEPGSSTPNNGGSSSIPNSNRESPNSDLNSNPNISRPNPNSGSGSCTSGNCGVNSGGSNSGQESPASPGTSQVPGSTSNGELIARGGTEVATATRSEPDPIYKADKAIIEAAFPSLVRGGNGSYILSISAKDCPPCQEMKSEGVYKQLGGLIQKEENSLRNLSKESKSLLDKFGLRFIPSNIPVYKRDGEYYLNKKLISEGKTDKATLDGNRDKNEIQAKSVLDKNDAAKIAPQAKNDTEKSPSETLQKRFEDADRNGLPPDVVKHLDRLSENGQDCSDGSCKLGVKAFDLVNNNGKYFTLNKDEGEKEDKVVYMPKGANLATLNTQQSAEGFVKKYNADLGHSGKPISLNQLEVPDDRDNLKVKEANKQEFTQWFDEKSPAGPEIPNPNPKPEEEKPAK